MVSVLYMIGLMCLLDMVPRGKIEPEFVVGHTRIIKDNPNYIYLHVRDDITNGGTVNHLTGLHAARVTGSAATWPVSRMTCPGEWPPWPDIGRDSKRQCGALEASENSGTLMQHHDWSSSLLRLSQGREQQHPFNLTTQTERGFLDQFRIETREHVKRKRFSKSQISKSKEKQMPSQKPHQSHTRVTREARKALIPAMALSDQRVDFVP